jgi:hypothetical protein
VIPFAAFALSLSTLGFELAIARWLAISHWDSLAFLVIAIAMFGLAAGGIAFQIRLGDRRLVRTGGAAAASDRSGQAAATLCLAGSVTLAGSFLVAKGLPLDWLLLPVQPVQLAWLTTTFLLLSLPFFTAGFLSCLAYAEMPGRAGLVSAASMGGSAVGAIGFLLLLPVVEEGRLVAVLAGVALLPPLLMSVSRTSRRPRVVLPGAAALCAAALAVGALTDNGRLFAITPSVWQALPQLLQLPGNRVIARQAGVWGRLDEVEGPHVRFAPGLSLQATEPVPAQRALVADGDSLTVLNSPDAVSFARFTHAWAGYILAGAGGARTSGPGGARTSSGEAADSSGPLQVLIVHGDGGLAAACALAAAPAEVTMVCESPGLARRMAAWYAGTGMKVVADNPRSFLARDGPVWDVIHIEKWGPSVPGMAGLSEGALLTVDALAASWRRLSDRGVLVVSRRLLLPPSDSVRLFATAVAALRAAGVGHPEAYLAVVRGVDSMTLLASRRPLRGGLLAGLRSFADRLSFDLDWFPGMAAADADRYQRFERPLFHEAYTAILADARFIGRYPLDVAPQSDDRPFPNRFLRWTRIGDFTALAGRRLTGLLLSTELVGGATLVLSVAAAAALLGLPLALRRRGAGRARGSTGLILACACIGVGYLFVEICIIDATAILFPGPLVPLALGLGAILGFGSLGGLASGRLRDGALVPILAGLAVGLPAAGVLLVPAAHAVLPFTVLPRALASFAALGPPAFLLGMPFPLLLRRAATPGHQSLAWAANGCTSIIASSTAALVAVAAGLSILPMLAGACYLLAAASMIFLTSAKEPQAE